MTATHGLLSEMNLEMWWVEWNMFCGEEQRWESRGWPQVSQWQHLSVVPLILRADPKVGSELSRGNGGTAILKEQLWPEPPSAQTRRVILHFCDQNHWETAGSSDAAISPCLSCPDLRREQREGDPRAEHAAGAAGGAVHPHQPPLLVPGGQHLHEAGDPGVPLAR